MSVNEFMGYSLFNDIDDVELRTRNQAVILANIAENGTDKTTKKITPKTAALILNYFKNVYDKDKAVVQTKFAKFMKERSYAVE